MKPSLLRSSSLMKLTRSIYGFYDLVLAGSHRLNVESLPSSLKAKNLSELSSQSDRANSDKIEGELSAEERIAKVFGGRIKGGDRVSSSRIMMGQPRVIAGVKVPDRPIEPDNCCMSGCINCVWEIYNDDIKNWDAKRRLAAKKLVEKGGVWPADFHPPLKLLKPENLPESLQNQSDVGKGDEESAWNKVPIEMRVFAELEKKIKSRKGVNVRALRP